MGLLRRAIVGVLAVIGFAAPTAWAQTPMSQCSVLSGRPCHPTFCSVFHRGPCMPYYQAPLGQDLRLTVESTDDTNAAPQPSPGARAAKPGDDGDSSSEPKLNSIQAMFTTLRGCWVPPPKDEARHGMEYTIRFAFKRDGELAGEPRVTYASHDAPAEVRDVYRDAVNAALARCTPLHFTDGMSGAVAGRPIAMRFVDSRTIDSPAKSQQ
jgi:hypothetical protein